LEEPLRPQVVRLRPQIQQIQSVMEQMNLVSMLKAVLHSLVWEAMQSFLEEEAVLNLGEVEEVMAAQVLQEEEVTSLH
jgi:hypothetical protein